MSQPILCRLCFLTEAYHQGQRHIFQPVDNTEDVSNKSSDRPDKIDQPDWDGIPSNPTKRWPHLLLHDGYEIPALWIPSDKVWYLSSQLPELHAKHMHLHGYRYVGPFIKPIINNTTED